jgi:hypothetical protein
VINIVDDVPTVGNFADFSVPNTSVGTLGPINTGFISGADGWSNINITGETIAGLTYSTLVASNGSVTLIATEDKPGGDDVFSYTVLQDGRQVFVLLKPEAETVSPPINLANLAAGNAPNFIELPDFSVEFSTKPGDTVNSSAQGMGVNDQFIEAGETLTIEFYDPGTSANDTANNTSGPGDATERLVTALTFTHNHPNDNNTLNWTVYNTVTGTQESGSVSFDGNTSFTIDPTIDFNKIELTGVNADTAARLSALTISERILPDGEQITFTVTGTDGDGDVTLSDDVTVTIDPNLPPPAPIVQPLSAPEDSAPLTTHTATDGADTLLATDDTDVFVWSLADNTVQGDSIVGFNAAADAINIADILADTVDTTDFSSYLDVSLEGASTVLRISNTGDFEHADQVITVQDVNLFEGVDFSDTAALTTALQNMVDSGKLITD